MNSNHSQPQAVTDPNLSLEFSQDLIEGVRPGSEAWNKIKISVYHPTASEYLSTQNGDADLDVFLDMSYFSLRLGPHPELEMTTASHGQHGQIRSRYPIEHEEATQHKKTLLAKAHTVTLRTTFSWVMIAFALRQLLPLMPNIQEFHIQTTHKESYWRQLPLVKLPLLEWERVVCQENIIVDQCADAGEGTGTARFLSGSYTYSPTTKATLQSTYAESLAMQANNDPLAGLGNQLSSMRLEDAPELDMLLRGLQLEGSNG